MQEIVSTSIDEVIEELQRIRRERGNLPVRAVRAIKFIYKNVDIDDIKDDEEYGPANISIGAFGMCVVIGPSL